MRTVILLRGINVGKANRIPMAELREALTANGLENVKTYVQSGNIVADYDGTPDALIELTHDTIARRFDCDIPVVVRTAGEIKKTVQNNPFPDHATDDPKHVQVSFLHAEPDPEAIKKLEQLATNGETITAIGREVYAWHPQGIADSKLALGLAGKSLGRGATARNWRTVTTLLEMVSDVD